MRRNKLLLSSLLVVLGTGVALAAAAIRGTWADDEPRDPARVGDPPVAQVLRLPDGGREVRAAIRLPHPPEEVWLAVTDYDHYGDLCEFIHGAQVEHGPDGCRMTGNAVTPLPVCLPISLDMKHQQELLEYTASWDAPSGDVLVNRGAWRARPVGDGETLLSVSLEIEVRGVPTWLLRNLSRRRLCHVLRAVEQRLLNGRPSGKPW